MYKFGILDFNALLSSYHRDLFIGIDILRLLDFPVQGTQKALKRELQLHDPRLVEVYQSSLFKQLANHNVASRIDSLIVIEITAWLPSHEETFNKIDRDVERAMKCTANSCRCNAHKKHRWTDA
jgi:hypothetical protein